MVVGSWACTGIAPNEMISRHRTISRLSERFALVFMRVSPLKLSALIRSGNMPSDRHFTIPTLLSRPRKTQQTWPSYEATQRGL